jgi:tRNA dimethylallyltransferase
MKKPKIIVITGPTASGKTKLSLKIAKKFNGEIVSADSRQVYKELNIGTDKIKKKERKKIKHYLLDVVSIKKKFTVFDYKKLAEKAIEEILKKGKLPILCGGSYFYIKALTQGLLFPPVPPDWKLRKKLEKKSKKELFSLLKKLDPQRAKTIDKNNPRRLIRALEIVIKSKKKVPPLLKRPLDFDFLIIAIDKSPSFLKKAIEKRFLKWLKEGLISEAKKIKKMRLPKNRIKEFGLHYQEIFDFLDKKISKKEMIENSIKRIFQFAKNQIRWLKKEKNIIWVKNEKEAERIIKKFLKQN